MIINGLDFIDNRLYMHPKFLANKLHFAPCYINI